MTKSFIAILITLSALSASLLGCGSERAGLTIGLIPSSDPEGMKLFDRRIEAFVPFEGDLYTDIRNISTILGRQYILDNFLNN